MDKRIYFINHFSFSLRAFFLNIFNILCDMAKPPKILTDAAIIAEIPMAKTLSDEEVSKTSIAPKITIPEIAFETLIKGACSEGVIPQIR